MPAGGFEPPFCNLAYSDYSKWKVPESNRPHGLLVHLTIIAALRYTFPCAFPYSTSEVEHDVFYLRRASASYLLVGSYPTTWGREELNLQCLPLGNGFTARRNTANRCRFPKMRGHLTPYLCMRPRYAYSIKSARHHRNGRIRTPDFPSFDVVN